MKPILLRPAILALALAANVTAQGATYIIDPDSRDLVLVDPMSGVEYGARPLVSDLGIVGGAVSAAVHPLTGTTFVIAEAPGLVGRGLFTLNVGTGFLTLIGDTGDSVSSITFDSTGTLWAVTGDGAATSETLYTVDLGTGALTFQATLGTGTDGEVIGFNPVDGFIYHCSGNTTTTFERIDPVSLAVTGITLSGFETNEVFGMMWDAATGSFLVSGINSDISYLTPTGFRSHIADTPRDWRGLFRPVGRSTFAVDPDLPLLHQVDVASGTELHSRTLTSPGATVFSAQAAAVHPMTGVVYVIAEMDTITNRALCTLDLGTGVLTVIGDCGDDVSGLAFDSAGTAWAVTGDGATTAETLYTVDLATAVLTFQATLGAGSDGQIITFNPSDGFLYVRSGRDTLPSLERIDPGTLGITSIVPSGYAADEFQSQIWDPASTTFFGTTIDAEVVSSTASGVQTLLHTDLPFDWRGLTQPYRSLEWFHLDPFSDLIRRVDMMTGDTLETRSARVRHSNLGLYVITGAGGAPSSLHEIDPGTGALIRTVGPTGLNHVTGLSYDFSTGSLFCVESPAGLRTIRLDNASASPVAAIGAFLPDMDFDPTTGRLFCWDETGDDLAIIDTTTGALTQIVSPVGTAETGLAVSPAGRVFVKSSNTIDEIDRATGASLSSVTLTGPGVSLDNILTFAPNGDLLTGNRNGVVFDLYEIDLGLGTFALRGTTPIADVSAIAFAPVEVPQVEGTNGYAIHPFTNQIYVIFEREGAAFTDRELGILDPLAMGTAGTAFITPIGPLGDAFSCLAFDDSGTLWGIVGDGGNAPEVLHTIDPADATVTPVMPLGNGADGETLVWNPADRAFYHSSGNGGPTLFERIDPVAMTVTNIPLSAPTTGEIFCLAYNAPTGNLLIGDINSRAFDLTTGGTLSGTGTTFDEDPRGLVPVKAAPTCHRTAPANGAALGATVSIVADFADSAGFRIQASYEFSTDGGATWGACTAAPASPSANPTGFMAGPLPGFTFIWDAMADLGTATDASLRIRVTDGYYYGMCTSAHPVGCATCGDCDLNMTGPTILDALVGAQIGAGIITPSPEQLLCCNVNASPIIDIIDALVMAQSAAGLPVVLNCP